MAGSTCLGSLWKILLQSWWLQLGFTTGVQVLILSPCFMLVESYACEASVFRSFGSTNCWWVVSIAGGGRRLCSVVITIYVRISDTLPSMLPQLAGVQPAVTTPVLPQGLILPWLLWGVGSWNPLASPLEQGEENYFSGWPWGNPPGHPEQ